MMKLFLFFTCVIAQAKTPQIPKHQYTSYGGTTKCLGNASGSTDPSADFSCNTYQVPSAWQKKSLDTKVDYDIALVGCGIGALYMSYRITKEALLANKPAPSIALFEMGESCGGRLQSQFGTGALNTATRPDKEVLQYPIQEYGGMRMNPFDHPRLYKAVTDWSHHVYGADVACKPADQCKPDENCCPKVLTRMHVNNIRYHSTNPNVGDNLNKSNIQETGPDSPYAKCLKLSELVSKRYNGDFSKAPVLFKDAANEMCNTCDKMEDKDSCTQICAFFPPETRAPAAVSCSGYDLGTADTVATAAICGLTTEVTSKGAHLYLFNNGFQNFAESLGFMVGKSNVAPMYNHQLIAVDTNCGNSEDLAKKQADSLKQSGPSNACNKTDDAPVTLTFANGAKHTAKMVYLTPLPFDLPQISGFDAWEAELLKYTNPNTAVKVVLGWSDASQALPARTNLKPCVSEGSPCDRLILDGKIGDQLLRQVWLWDEKTIMVYLTAPADFPNEFPANLIAKKAWKEGMDKTVNAIVEQLRIGTGVADLATPDYARFKHWTSGALLIDWKAGSDVDGATISSRFSRPLGNAAPVYYGNSEMAANGSNHGWVEGALDMADSALESILPALGLHQEVHI